MRLAAVLPLLLAAACSRPPASRRAEPGIHLEQVKLTTWAGPDLKSRGTAERARLTQDGFTADRVVLDTASGLHLTAPRVEGLIELTHATASAVALTTADGCAASSPDRVEWHQGVATTFGPVTAGGCGFELSGSRVTYDHAQRRAEVFGPVRTRVEARKP